jgi:hypothetical protein
MKRAYFKVTAKSLVEKLHHKASFAFLNVVIDPAVERTFYHPSLTL